MRRASCVVLFLAIAGCESLRTQPPTPVARTPEAPARPIPRTPEPPKPATELLRAAAAQPRTPDAPQSPPPATEAMPEDSLTLMTDALSRGDYATAATHLESYVRANPEQAMFRLQLAELYSRATRFVEAKHHYEEFLASAETGPPALRAHLATTHAKLREIAVNANDRFGEAFHRGAGLLVLVKEQDADANRDDQFREEMLCKAIRALLEAKTIRPHNDRVRTLLAEAHEAAGHHREAESERAALRASGVSGELTPRERNRTLLRE